MLYSPPHSNTPYSKLILATSRLYITVPHLHIAIAHHLAVHGKAGLGLRLRRKLDKRLSGSTPLAVCDQAHTARPAQARAMSVRSHH